MRSSLPLTFRATSGIDLSHCQLYSGPKQCAPRQKYVRNVPHVVVSVGMARRGRCCLEEVAAGRRRSTRGISAPGWEYLKNTVGQLVRLLDQGCGLTETLGSLNEIWGWT